MPKTKSKVKKIAKDFNTLFVKNFDKNYDEFRKATEGLRHIPPERLRLPMN